MLLKISGNLITMYEHLKQCSLVLILVIANCKQDFNIKSITIYNHVYVLA